MKADLPPSLDFSSSSPPPPSSVHLSSAISRQDPSFSSSSSFLSPSLLLSRSCLSSSSSSSSSSVSSRNGNLYLSVQRDKGVLVSLTPTLTEEDISCFVATVHARTSEKERRRSKCLEASSLRTSPFSPSSSSSSSSLYPPSRSSTGDKQKLSHSLVSRRSEEEEDVESSGSNFHREDTPSEGEKEEEEAKKEKRRRRRRKIEEGHAQATEEKKEEEEEEEEMYGISLRGVGLQDDSLSILVTCILRSQFLRIIDLSDNRLTDESVRILAECMPCLPYLRYLNLSHNSRLTVESLVKISKAFFPDFSTSSSSSTIVSTSSSSSSSLPLSRREEKMIEKNDTVSLRASESMHSNQHHRGGPSHTIEVSRPSHLAGRYFSRVERREGRKALTKEEEEEEKRKRGVYHLDLSDNFLGPEGCCSIAETIKCNSCLARLYLRNTGGECGGLLPLMATETFLKALDFSHADLSSSSFSRSSSPAPPPPAAPLASPPPASLSSSPSSFPLLPQSRSSRFFFSSSSSSCSMPLCEAKAVGEGRRVSVSSLFVQDERSIEREEKSHVFQRDSNCVMSTSRATTTSTTVFSTSTTASHDIVIAASQSPDRHEQLYGSSSSSPSSSSGTKDEGLVAMVEANEKKSFSATSPSSSTSMVTSVLSSSMFLRPFRRAPRPEARSTPGKGERDMKRKGEKSHSSHSTIMDDRRREIYRDEKDSEDTKRKECAIRMNVMKEERREKEKERRASLRSLKKKGFFTSSSQQGDGDGGREEEDWMREIEGYSSLYSPVEGQEDEKERDLERRRLAGRDLQMLLCISEGLSHLLTASNALQELNLSYCTWSSSSISHPYHDTKRSKGKHGPQTTSSLPSRLGGDLGKEDCGRREREEKMYGVQYADQLIDILAEALKKNTSLRSLAFAGNGMTAVGLRRLCEGLGGDASVCRIEELNLACNDLHEALPLAELLLINHTIRIVDVANCVLSGEAIEHLLSALEGNDTLSILVLAHNSMNRQSISKLAEVLKYQHARIFMKEERTKEEEEGKRNEESEDDRKEGRDKKDEEEEKRKIRVEIENREEKKDMTVEDKKKEDGEVPRDEEGSDDEKKEERKASREKNPTHSTLGSSSPDHRHDSNESSSYSPPDNSSSYSPSPPSCSPPPFPCCCSCETSLHAQKGRSAREKKKRQFCSACHGYVLDREEYEHLGLASGDGECSGIERDFELGFASLSQLPRRGLRMVDLSFTIPRDGSALLPLAQALPHLPLLLFLDVSS
ncbi:leucine rich repeat-containing protein, partial [Cystoisospora suis]